ncbi:MAG: hypothetical protein JW797_03255 [Bradymonadales bacterium]|nr:hypothetical protein [Bradymonadales bacterium]
MFEGFLANVGDYIHTNPGLALVAVFLGGLLAASTPCVLAMVPWMMSVVAGRREERLGVLRALRFSLAFVLGLAMTFTALGMIAALAGSGSSVVWGGALLLVYALGHSVLNLIAGTSMGAARRLIESRRTNRALDIARRVAGGVIVLVGVYFAYRGLL